MASSEPRPRNRRGGPSRNRNTPRASLACLKCRERKIKCDAQAVEGRGTCTPCHSSGTQCIMRHDDDRKWRASRNYINALERRIRSLEGSIKHSVPYPLSETTQPSEGAVEYPTENSPLEVQNIYSEPGGLSSTTLRDATCNSSCQRLAAGSPSEMAATPLCAENLPSYDGEMDLTPIPIQTIQASRSMISNCSETNLPSISQSSTPLLDPISHPLGPRESEPQIATTSLLQPRQGRTHLEASSTSEAHPYVAVHSTPSAKPGELVTRARSTSPSYEDDRQVKPKVRLRCFGPTCPLHVLLRPARPGLLPNQKSRDNYSSPMDSEQFQRDLLNIYFEFQPLSVAVVHKETFMENFSLGTPNEYYSEFLLNCILACAVRLSTRDAIRSLSSLYIKRAKMCLADELENAVIATLQGFCLLSEFEMSSGRDQAGWLYAGIACRLLFDLGLHQDCSDLVRTGHLSDIEATVRRQAFFGCLVTERLWSIYLGRPTLVKVSDFSTVRPRITDPSFEIQTQAAWVDLSIISSEIADIFNCPSLIDEQTIRKLIQVDARLHTWYDSLPLALGWKDPGEDDLHPYIYALHMQFYGIQILVFRTSIMTKRKFSPAAFSEEEVCKLRGYTLDKSRQTYRDSAVRIARLLVAFQNKVGIERVPTVMLDNLYIAAIALISYVSRANMPKDALQTDVQWLVSLLDALENLAIHYPVATRMRLTLSDVLERSWLANSADAPLYSKLLTQNIGSTAQQPGDHTPGGMRRPTQSRKTPPVFEMADLWIIPQDYSGDIGYPQLSNIPDGTRIAYEDMDLNRSPTLDMGTFYVNGMDLLEM